MSLILNGIDLPKNGDCHHITIYDNGNTYITTSNVLYETDRKDVEAIQIPKGHGRLIDADALELEKEVELADDWKTAHEIANCVKYAPTILEAEETHSVCGLEH